MTRRSGASRRQPRARRQHLGLWTMLIVAVLIGAYVVVLNLSRPHVNGDRLRFDSFVSLADSGRIRDARILDEDSIVVGRYVADEAGGPGTAASGGGAGALGHDHAAAIGGSDVGVTPATVPTGSVPTGPVRAYNAPLVRGTQQDLVLKVLLADRVPINVDQQVKKRVANLAAMLLPGLALVVLFAYVILSSRRGTGLFAVRSGARRFGREDSAVTFADVAGQDAAIAELRDVTRYLSDPGRIEALGAQVPKGILLYGPPGCGKTMLARAMATETGAAFFSISGSDFVELYVGVGASRVRDLFKEAREHAPALVFVDELDSVGRARADALTAGGPGEREQALNQILVEMDGFSTTDGIIVLAATNRPDILDQALLRPGRFDRTVALALPDEPARLAILEVHARGKSLAGDVDLAAIAQRAIGLTGADLAAVMNESVLLAARDGRDAATGADTSRALQRILDAPERQRRLSLKGRSIGRRFTDDDRVTFADVAGVDDAIAELADVRDFLVLPDRFAALGARAPRGILLSGPPGCGKTLLARALAGEANAAFFSVAASEFVEVFVGAGAARVRDMFSEARAMAPSIVFIDEIDAIGARRFEMGAHREQEQTLNQILVELDGFQTDTAVVVVAATNRPDLLDPALVRPGRFDRHVAVTPPDRAGRRAILDLHVRDKRLGPDVDLDALAGVTRGLAGADLANVVNEAALLSVRRGDDHLSMAAFDEAVDRALLGIRSSGTVVSDEERAMVAYHEAGHAVVRMVLPGANPAHKLTIVAHGDALGHCVTVADTDRVVLSRSAMVDEMAAGLGGRVAEQLVYGEPGSAAGSDLRWVNHLARRMVCELGMSEAMGALAYNDGWSAHSPEGARLVDAEIRAFLDDATERAHSVLTTYRDALDRIADALLERETVTADEVRAVVGSARVTTDRPDAATGATGTAVAPRPIRRSGA